MEYTNTGLSIVSQNICLAEVDNVDWSCDMSEQEVHGKSENQSKFWDMQSGKNLNLSGSRILMRAFCPLWRLRPLNKEDWVGSWHKPHKGQYCQNEEPGYQTKKTQWYNHFKLMKISLESQLEECSRHNHFDGLYWWCRVFCTVTTLTARLYLVWSWWQR